MLVLLQLLLLAAALPRASGRFSPGSVLSGTDVFYSSVSAAGAGLELTGQAERVSWASANSTLLKELPLGRGCAAACRLDEECAWFDVTCDPQVGIPTLLPPPPASGHQAVLSASQAGCAGLESNGTVCRLFAPKCGTVAPIVGEISNGSDAVQRTAGGFSSPDRLHDDVQQKRARLPLPAQQPKADHNHSSLAFSCPEGFPVRYELPNTPNFEALSSQGIAGNDVQCPERTEVPGKCGFAALADAMTACLGIPECRAITHYQNGGWRARLHACMQACMHAPRR